MQIGAFFGSEVRSEPVLNVATGVDNSNAALQQAIDVRIESI
jgi:hypothetical protein